MSKRYYLYSRKRKDKPAVWYARFRSDDGTIGSPVCTQQINESKAEQWAVEALLKGEILSIRKPRAPTFEEWSTPWWIHGKCPYITEKIANGYNIRCAAATSLTTSSLNLGSIGLHTSNHGNFVTSR